MKCSTCDHEVSADVRICPACGTNRYSSPYVQLAGVIGGVAGSLLAYTLFSNMFVALVGGLAGVLIGVLGAKMLLPILKK